MRRRDFISGIVGSALWPRLARAQQPALPVVGFLSGVSLGPFERRVAAFRRGLQETGYIAGENVLIEYDSADGQYDRLPALVDGLVRRRVAVIVAYTDRAAREAKEATTHIPIVFLVGSDPVKLGLVPSLNRPGNNITGVNWFGVDLAPKQLSLLHELVPNAAVIALLVDQNIGMAASQVSEMEEAARTLRLRLVVKHVRTGSDIETEFANLAQRADMLVVGAGAFLVSRRKQIIALAERYGIPTIYGFREYTVDGGLISYGNDIPEAFRRAGVYTGRILKGEKPAELPVDRTTKFELVINLKTAKTLKLTVSNSMQLLANEVIE